MAQLERDPEEVSTAASHHLLWCPVWPDPPGVSSRTLSAGQYRNPWWRRCNRCRWWPACSRHLGLPCSSGPRHRKWKHPASCERTTYVPRLGRQVFKKTTVLLSLHTWDVHTSNVLTVSLFLRSTNKPAGLLPILHFLGAIPLSVDMGWSCALLSGVHTATVNIHRDVFVHAEL